jgi:hypothetical protein
MSESAAPARAARICPHPRSNALRQINDARIDWQLEATVDICSPSEPALPLVDGRRSVVAR